MELPWRPCIIKGWRFPWVLGFANQQGLGWDQAEARLLTCYSKIKWKECMMGLGYISDQKIMMIGNLSWLASQKLSG